MPQPQLARENPGPQVGLGARCAEGTAGRVALRLVTMARKALVSLPADAQTIDVGAGDVSAGDDCAGDVGAGDDCAGDVGAGDVCVDGTASDDLHAAERGAHQCRPPVRWRSRGSRCRRQPTAEPGLRVQPGGACRAVRARRLGPGRPAPAAPGPSVAAGADAAPGLNPHFSQCRGMMAHGIVVPRVFRAAANTGCIRPMDT